MPATHLAAALKAVDWKANVETFIKDAPAAERVARAQLRLAIWAKQLENVEKKNPALCFVREMQVAGHQVAALIALGLYKSAAGAIRTSVETALYYTYFRTHVSELATLMRVDDYYITKSDVIAYHKVHTPDFVKCQEKLGLITKLNEWYSDVSAVVHGQIPGKWVEHKSLAEIKYVKPTLDVVVGYFARADELVHHLFLCTVGRELWDFFSVPAKQALISGLPGDTKKLLKIDAA